MRVCGLSLRLLLFSAACWACGVTGFAQEQTPPRQAADVVRVNTALVQTDVMVFDKQGVFVDGLKRDQFVLKINGKPREVSFFERILAGSRNEEAQIAAARGGSSAVLGTVGAVPLDRGRTIFFFIDDLHLSLSSSKQTRLLLERFIDRQMGQNDEAAITSASGQIGFLQQLTDDKRVLKAATERLKPRLYSMGDFQRPVMTEYQAQLIQSENDDVLSYFVDELIRLEPNLSRPAATSMIHGRASQIAQQSNYFTSGTLNSLKVVVKNATGLPGRKLIFLISDGFLLDNKNSDSNDRLRQITSAAAAAGVIIYSIDARGLTSGLPDASREMPFDPAGRLVRGAAGELTASQDGLNALAADTGGRAFLNSNDLSVGVTQALKETSAYYLLAWRPEDADQHNQRSRRIEVSVKGRPELVIRFHHGFGDSPPAESASLKKVESGSRPAGELMGETLRAIYPKSDLPVSISLNFLDLDKVGQTLTTSVKIATNSLTLEPQADQQVAILDVAGGVYDDRGKPVSTFNKHLTIKTNSNNPKAPPPTSIFYNHFTTIKPGLYQIRVAAVDPKLIRAGSAVAWIEIPDISARILTLSSLIVGERRTETEVDSSTADAPESGKSPEALRQVYLNIDHHFASSSRLRFLTFVYNAGSISAAPAATERPNSLTGSSTTAFNNGPDLAVQVQLFRDDEPVITMPLHKIQIDALSDPGRLPYAAELSLEGLRSGRYVLLVTVIDRVAKASASQKFGFQVD